MEIICVKSIERIEVNILAPLLAKTQYHALNVADYHLGLKVHRLSVQITIGSQQ